MRKQVMWIPGRKAFLEVCLVSYRDSKEASVAIAE